MTIQEILGRHIADVCNHGDIECRCGERCDTPEAHRAHLAEVLDKHMQEEARRAQVNALNGVASAWEEMASPGAHHLYARMLRETANRIGAEPNGR